MASSGSGSRKGFPEAGGKHCKPQGQEDMLSLKGHRSDCFPSEEYSVSSSKPGQGYRRPYDRHSLSLQSGDQEVECHLPGAQRAVPLPAYTARK